MFLLLILLSIGAAAGILSGLFGIGGGIIVVPTLAYLFQSSYYHLVPEEFAMQMAIATSLAIIFFTSLASTYSHHSQGSVRWDIWRQWMIGILVGSLIGACVTTHLNTTSLKFLFSLFLLGIVIKMLFLGKNTKDTTTKTVKTKTRIPLALLGIAIGLSSGLLGVGGGLLMMPILLSLGCNMSESAATSSASSVLFALIASLVYITLGFTKTLAIPYAIGYLYWPAVLVVGIMGIIFAPVGAKLSYRIPAKWTQRTLIVLLLAIALDMLVKSYAALSLH